jgi:tRNA pseudouridine38-40 synthase
VRVVLGIAYRGQAYLGWQSQPGGRTVQDQLERALARFADRPLSTVRTVCAGRTDTGVHALNQVVHLDTELDREAQSWVRGSNRFLPPDIAIQWCRLRDDSFHARYSAQGRRYIYILLESTVRPAIEAGSAGWSFRALDGAAMRSAADLLIGEHDFSAFRSSECQAPSPIKTMRAIEITRHGAYWRFSFDASAFLHHMVRNLMGSMLAVGSGARDLAWLSDVLARGNRALAAPTFPADGLYFVGPYYDASHDLPTHTAAMSWLPGAAIDP